MKEFPHFDFYPKDFLSSTYYLTARQRGIYIVLLCVMWSKGGSLPKDTESLARYANVSLEEFEEDWPAINDKFQLRSGRLVQPRLTAELDKARSRSGAARANANARWSQCDRNATHQPPYTSKKPPLRSPPKGAHQIPPDFEPNEGWLIYAKQQGFDDEQAKKQLHEFKEYFMAKGTRYKDWNRCLQNWLRRAKEFQDGKSNTKDDGWGAVYRESRAADEEAEAGGHASGADQGGGGDGW